MQRILPQSFIIIILTHIVEIFLGFLLGRRILCLLQQREGDYHYLVQLTLLSQDRRCLFLQSHRNSQQSLHPRHQVSAQINENGLLSHNFMEETETVLTDMMTKFKCVNKMKHPIQNKGKNF